MEQDFRNPQQFPAVRKWTITFAQAIATLCIALSSSAYAGGVRSLKAEFGASQEVIILGLSLFVLGFAIGPLLFAPMSELWGRQIVLFATYGALTAFTAGCAGAQNIETVIVLRFLAGAFGSSPLANAGGVIADMFTASQRGFALTLFATAPFLGPILGPITGSFIGETQGWRWIQGFLACFAGAVFIMTSVLCPEVRTMCPFYLADIIKLIDTLDLSYSFATQASC